MHLKSGLEPKLKIFFWGSLIGAGKNRNISNISKCHKTKLIAEQRMEENGWVVGLYVSGLEPFECQIWSYFRQNASFNLKMLWSWLGLEFQYARMYEMCSKAALWTEGLWKGIWSESLMKSVLRKLIFWTPKTLFNEGSIMFYIQHKLDWSPFHIFSNTVSNECYYLTPWIRSLT